MAFASVVVAVLYVITGWIGHVIANPAGQATIIWPPAGVSLAAVLVLGTRVWPGVWLGSFLMGAQLSGGLTLDGIEPSHLLLPALVAIGAGLQAVLIGGIARARYGLPIRIGSWMEAMSFTLFAGPMGTVISATIGTAVLLAMGRISGAGAAAECWWTWWTGDLLGIAVVVPLVLFSNWLRMPRLLWRGRPVPELTNGSFLCVLLGLAGSFWAWSVLSQAETERSTAAFEAQASEVSRLIASRIESYGGYVDGGAALLRAQGQMARADWARLVRDLDFRGAVPGALGLGVIQPVADADLAAFAAANSGIDGRPLAIHPAVETPMHYVIRFIEPEEHNDGARGLDLAFAPAQVEALQAAARSGQATLSGPIRLVQDQTASVGLVLLRAVYHTGTPAAAQDVIGWVYTPFLAATLLEDITGVEHAGYRLRVYDGAGTGGEQIFDSGPAPEARPMFALERSLSVQGRDWTLAFDSTPLFDATHGLGEAKLILAAGILLSLGMGTLMTLLLRREQQVLSMVDRKARELATQDSHTRSIIETAMVGFVLLDPRGRMLSLNHAAEEIFGLPASGLAGRRLRDLLPVDMPLGSEADGRSCQHEMRRADGSVRQIEVQINPWADADGEARATAILRDVTQRHTAEALLRENERRLNMAMTGAQIAVFDIDLRTGAEVVSQNWVDLMGFPPGTRAEDLDARAEFEARVLPEDRVLIRVADDDCIAGRTERSIVEYRVRAADGSLRWMRSEAIVSTRAADGTALRLLGVQTDVTRLRDALDTITHKEAQFRAVIEHAPMGMALLDVNCRLIRVNEAFCRFSGYAPEDLLDRFLGDLIPPGGRVISEADRAALRAGETPVVQMERLMRRNDGIEVWGLLNISMMGMGDGQGDGVAFIVQIQDITERRKVEQMKSDFVATVSHELRTPLTSIKGALGLVLGTMGRDLPAKAERLLSIGQKNCDRLIMLVNDILDLEKLNSGKMRFELADAPLSGLLDQAVAVNQPYADDLGVTIRLAPVAADLAVRVDRDRFQQVMSNLLSNAAKFSPRGAAVTMSARADGDMAEIRVRDRGPGIPEEFRARIFTPFSQADSSATREKGGTGLGLNITHQILEQMDGSIDFENQPDGGCEFRIRVPAVSGLAGTATEVAGRSRAGTATGGAPRILHVEDDADFAEVFRSAFGDRAEVETAGSIAAARRLLADTSYDLVVIDWTLSDGDGRVLLDEIEAPVPIFGLSASEPARPDPRVARQAVKSRARLDQLVGDCLAAVA
ncbi:PAS domain S-box protein [Frigidibacter sp. MR17.14]|uniref:PAS domain S-box protein n=1 Tax=Frigidibacter sp. MR17.14 TaxID=3126509 RepID=UPI0030129FB1